VHTGLMRNHYHLLLENTLGNLAQIMSTSMVQHDVCQRQTEAAGHRQVTPMKKENKP